MATSKFKMRSSVEQSSEGPGIKPGEIAVIIVEKYVIAYSNVYYVF